MSLSLFPGSSKLGNANFFFLLPFLEFVAVLLFKLLIFSVYFEGESLKLAPFPISFLLVLPPENISSSNYCFCIFFIKVYFRILILLLRLFLLKKTNSFLLKSSDFLINKFSFVNSVLDILKLDFFLFL